MKSLLVIKAYIKKFVGKNEVFITPILKFLLSFMALSQISNKLGYFTKLASGPVVLIIALAGSFLPVNLTLVIIAAVTLAHLYKLSLEVAIVVLAIFLILFLLYFRFAASDSYAAMLTPLAFIFKMPYIMPISMGLVGTPSSMVSVGSGVIIYNVLHYVSQNADAIQNGGTAEDGPVSVDMFRTLIDGIMSNRNMFVLAVAFAATVLVVYIIRKLPMNYCWFIAIGAGFFTMLIATAAANKVLGGTVSVGGMFVGLIVSVIANIILQFFVFDLDYQRTEKVQFEDDEYYYYVKAVPKNDIHLKKKKSSGAPVPVRSNMREASTPSKPARPVIKKPVLPKKVEEPEEEMILVDATAPLPDVRRAVNTSNDDYAKMGRSVADARAREEAARKARAERYAQERMEKNRETTTKIIEPLTEDDI